MFVVMSDSHGDRSVIENIKKEYQDKASAIFHCGDSELASDDKIWQGIKVVKGNCDYDSGYQEVQTLQLENQKILLTHGHLYGLNTLGFGRLPELAAAAGADIVLFGHIHRPVAKLVDKTLFLNPGSVSQPRGDWQIKMYATVSIVETELVKTFQISYRDLQHQPIPKLQFDLKILKEQE